MGAGSSIHLLFPLPFSVQFFIFGLKANYRAFQCRLKLVEFYMPGLLDR